MIDLITHTFYNKVNRLRNKKGARIKKNSPCCKTKRGRTFYEFIVFKYSLKTLKYVF